MPLSEIPPESVSHYDEIYLLVEEIRRQNGRAAANRANAEAHFAYTKLPVLRGGALLVDVPCGLGYHADCFAQLSGGQISVLGIDGSPSNVSFAKQRPRQLNVDFKVGLFDELDTIVGENCADAVCCMGSSFGLDIDPYKSLGQLEKMHKILRPGSSIFLQARYGERFAPGHVSHGENSPVNGPMIWGVDESGRRIGYYTKEYPLSSPYMEIPADLIPGECSERVVSMERFSHVFVDHDGTESEAPAFTYCNCMNPSGAQIIGGHLKYNDIPILRAFCTKAGFRDLQIVPAAMITNGSWMIGMIGKKPIRDIDLKC